MTFIDAAVAILRESGRPLHFKKITELAVERGLLSHVGKTPEVTMEVRLTEAAEEEGGAPIRCVRKGVFAFVQAADIPAEPTNSSVRAAKPEAVPARTPASATANPKPAPVADDSQPRNRQRRQQHQDGPAKPDNPVAERAPSRLRERHNRKKRSQDLVQLFPENSAQPALVDALTGILAANDAPLSVSEIAHQLGATKLALVSPMVVEATIHTENRNRLSAERPPRFVRTSEGWLLGSETLLRPLIDSYAAVERARIDLDRVATAALEQAITMLTGRQLEAFVTGVISELGFSPSVIDHDARMTSWEATSTRGLIPLKAVVCLWHGNIAIGASAIAGLRDLVRRTRSTLGLFLALNRQDLGADVRREAEASHTPPITLVDAAALAALALEAGVGVVRVPTDIPVLDANWFGHLEDG